MRALARVPASRTDLGRHGGRCGRSRCDTPIFPAQRDTVCSRVKHAPPDLPVRLAANEFCFSHSILARFFCGRIDREACHRARILPRQRRASRERKRQPSQCTSLCPADAAHAWSLGGPSAVRQLDAGSSGEPHMRGSRARNQQRGSLAFTGSKEAGTSIGVRTFALVATADLVGAPGLRRPAMTWNWLRNPLGGTGPGHSRWLVISSRRGRCLRIISAVVIASTLPIVPGIAQNRAIAGKHAKKHCRAHAASESSPEVRL